MIAAGPPTGIERFRPLVFVPAAIRGGCGRPGGRRVRADQALDDRHRLALLLLGQFRLWDDLADRERDRAAHPRACWSERRASRPSSPRAWPRARQRRPRRLAARRGCRRGRGRRARRRGGRLVHVAARRSAPPRPISCCSRSTRFVVLLAAGSTRVSSALVVLSAAAIYGARVRCSRSGTTLQGR